MYSLCESVHASGRSPWHIRKLTAQGKFLGGGIDTQSLCGHVKYGWDVNVEITPQVLDNCACKECRNLFDQMNTRETQGNSNHAIL